VEQVLALAWFIFDPRGELRGYPTLRGFFTQSAESLEKKKVEFLLSAKECGRM